MLKNTQADETRKEPPYRLYNAAELLTAMIENREPLTVHEQTAQGIRRSATAKVSPQHT